MSSGKFDPQQFLILVVDDISQNLQLLIAMLDGEGYATTFASSGQQALTRVQIAPPDLILLDLMMPEMNGLQVCEKLQTDPLYRQIPVIFLTASHDEQHLLQAFERGAVDYIKKPFNAPELLARVKTHLELKQTKDKLQETLTKLQQAYKEVKRLAITDPLTGVANRRHLLSLGVKEFQVAYRGKYPLSVLMLDLDRFKSINDTYGHAFGDEVLTLLAEVIENNLRPRDFLGRFGGEEFLVFLPKTDTSAALELAENIRKNLAEVAFVNEQEVIKVTTSIGVATYRKEDEKIESLLKRADVALYAAKNQGRNRVVVSGEKSQFMRDNISSEKSRSTAG